MRSQVILLLRLYDRKKLFTLSSHWFLDDWRNAGCLLGLVYWVYFWFVSFWSARLSLIQSLSLKWLWLLTPESHFSGCTHSNDLPVSLMLLVTSLSDFLCDITVSQVAERKPSPLWPGWLKVSTTPESWWLYRWWSHWVEDRIFFFCLFVYFVCDQWCSRSC